ncbi:hypothetical protein VMCG_09116 [Cytospora schulzeri]|uniref:UDP-N-acetylglucosamine transferase subunit ALG13 n=1 Tax=Cytospora schulzeri TaxID=448051 RepID=A0A423VMY4_9PEZI|nr:hypothetical protein VMCG_09116 [Valsa malicola]
MGQEIGRIAGEISRLFGLGRHYGYRYDLDVSYGENAHIKMNRHVIVTGGAIVPFVELLLEVTTPEFLAALRAHGFTHLHLQCNNFVGEMQKRLSEMDEKDLHGIEIDVIHFDMRLKENMRRFCRGEEGVQPAGLVIGHAGTGTIADADESEVALVIVANPNLMDDHQTPFSFEIVKEYDNLILGHLGRVVETIPKAIELIEQLGLDHLDPYVKPDFPINPDAKVSLIDRVIASGL